VRKPKPATHRPPKADGTNHRAALRRVHHPSTFPGLGPERTIARADHRATSPFDKLTLRQAQGEGEVSPSLILAMTLILSLSKDEGAA
jgi:hypothetical protein